jgi:hypothetical protein
MRADYPKVQDRVLLVLVRENASQTSAMPGDANGVIHTTSGNPPGVRAPDERHAR